MVGEPFSQHETGRIFTDLYQTTASEVVVGISTREKGISVPPYQQCNLGLHVGDQPEHVITNRERLSEDLGVPLDQWVAAEQVHGNDIKRVYIKDQGKGSRSMTSAIKGVDGLYTTDPDLMLVEAYADCVPLFFIAKNGKATGIAHAGWRGTVGEIAGKMIQAWQEDLKFSPNDIDVLIGPSIGPCCYEVDDRVINEFKRLEQININELAVPTTKGHYQLNLQLANQRILEKAGVPASNIQTTTYCTSCRTDLFFSHRKESGKTGRMLGYIGIRRRD